MRPHGSGPPTLIVCEVLRIAVDPVVLLLRIKERLVGLEVLLLPLLGLALELLLLLRLQLHLALLL